MNKQTKCTYYVRVSRSGLLYFCGHKCTRKMYNSHCTKLTETKVHTLFMDKKYLKRV